jgi:hypothetical protein
MHPIMSEMMSREKAADRLREAEFQRLARGVRAEDVRRNKIRTRGSWVSNRLADVWARALN